MTTTETQPTVTLTPLCNTLYGLNYATPCLRAATIEAVAGCEHEHIDKVRYCEAHFYLAKNDHRNYCKKCYDHDQHKCPRHIISSQPAHPTTTALASLPKVTLK